MKKIYVGNFGFDVTEPELRSMFEPYGTVESVTVVTDRDTGRSRGFGFVEMSDDGAASKAIEALNGTAAGGRPLTVNEARPKTDRGGRGGNDRGSRGGNDRGSRRSRW
jgi:cold-inducible RNA-binding protein